MIPNFSWVDPGKLAASGNPAGMFRLDQLRQELRALRQQGIGLVVSLTEQTIDPALLADEGLKGLHLPTPDMTPPTLYTIDAFMAATEATVQRNAATLVHCQAGLGRTGTLAACYLIHQGMSAEGAVAQVRQMRPGSIETPEQAIVVHEYAVRQAEKLAQQD